MATRKKTTRTTRRTTTTRRGNTTTRTTRTTRTTARRAATKARGSRSKAGMKRGNARNGRVAKFIGATHDQSDEAKQKIELAGKLDNKLEVEIKGV